MKMSTLELETREGEGEEMEEEFHESFDRILSSSSSSTSASDDESSPSTNTCADRRRSRNHKNISFPPNSSSFYDVWNSVPSSVEERRRDLLQRLGLIGDPSLSRYREPVAHNGGLVASNEKEFDRSYTYPRLSPNSPSPTTAPVPRSRSEPHWSHELPAEVDDMDVCDDYREEVSDADDKYCIVKNLDSGVEFVVKEVREDGMWNKLSEVGTGRQLTLEEFRRSVIGHSPIVEELMKRQNNEVFSGNGGSGDGGIGKENGNGDGSLPRFKKRGSWLRRSIRNMADNIVNGGEKKSSDEKDTSSSEKGGRRSSSGTDDSQDLRSNHWSERIKVKHYGRSWKEFTGLYMNQEINAHSGSIWSIKFSLDGKHLASAGEDCVIHVWKVLELEGKKDVMVEKGLREMDNWSHFNPFSVVSTNGSPEMTDGLSNSEKRRRAKVDGIRKSFSLDHVIVPEKCFAFSEKPVCSFVGHQKDILDLSWSKSKLLLSSSMDKTVRLWDMSTTTCLRTFTHNDYVTCIQFNPVNDKYFISGSLDAKVRLWSIEHRQVVDWNDLHEMVTATCYTPDGLGAFVGSHKGNCNFFNTLGNKLQERSLVNLKNKKSKSHPKKITGFQFSPKRLSEVLITSADSRIRVVDDFELVHKFKGFRNTSSQISASITADGKHVVCASEDSHVYIWRYDSDYRPSRSKGVINATQSYEYFHCHDVSVAVAWPGLNVDETLPTKEANQSKPTKEFVSDTHCKPKSPLSPYERHGIPHKPTISTENRNLFHDRISSTWPEENLMATTQNQAPLRSGESVGQTHNGSAWRMVIVTAGRGGEIKVFQNFGCPIHV